MQQNFFFIRLTGSLLTIYREKTVQYLTRHFMTFYSITLLTVQFLSSPARGPLASPLDVLTHCFAHLEVLRAGWCHGLVG